MKESDKKDSRVTKTGDQSENVPSRPAPPYRLPSYVYQKVNGGKRDMMRRLSR